MVYIQSVSIPLWFVKDFEFYLSHVLDITDNIFMVQSSVVFFSQLYKSMALCVKIIKIEP